MSLITNATAARHHLLDFDIRGSMTLTAGQCAQMLGLSERTFDRKRAELTKAGFPNKLPAINKWSRPAVVAWITTNGGTIVAPTLGIPNDDPELNEIVSDLEHQYGSAA